MSGEKILLVDDERDILHTVSNLLQSHGFTTVLAANGQEGLRLLYQHHPALVLLDVSLKDPDMNGFTVCRRIREISQVPIIMLTGQKEPEDIVEGLEAGADDYILKPFDPKVLVARVRANLRRASAETNAEQPSISYNDGYLSVNVDERRVTRDGQAVRLSPTEFNLLVQLIGQAPKVVAYRDLLAKVWGQEYIDDIDYLRVYVWHLRRKLEKNAKEPVYIANELGVGYRFEKQT